MKARFLRLITTLLILLLLNSLSFSQNTPKYLLGPGEYNCWIIPTATHQVYDLSTGVPSLVAGQPSVVTAVSGNLHHQCLLDDQGNVYCWGDNSVSEIGNGTTGGPVANPTRIAVDSLGNAFGNIVQVYAGGSSLGYLTAALKSDGTLWMWGTTAGGNRGNGTWGGSTTRPVQIPFPAGTVIKKFAMNNIGLALDANGNVWTWGGAAQYPTPWLLGQGTGSPDITTPHKVSLPSPASDISGGGYTNYALLANGQLWGWGYDGGYLGLGKGVATGVSPVALNPTLGFTQAIKSIAVSNSSTYVILADGTLWSWGDNACGTIGNGTELNYATYINSAGQATPYGWDWGAGEYMVGKPVQIGQGINNFTNIWTGMGDVFYCYAEDANGQLYSWGRNKYGVVGNGVGAATGSIGASYPNSWDVPWITAIDPFGIKSVSLSSSPYCVLNPGTSPCNGYAIPNVAAPVANAGQNQNISGSTTTLTGTATTANSNTQINYWLWTQLSGPSAALITLPSGPTAKLSNLLSGTYVFQLKVTDNNWRTSTSQVTVVVGGTNTNLPPAAKPVSSITITLPVTIATLDGSASSDPDGTIASYAWQQTAGPNSATINTPTAAITTIKNLVAGTYTFSLTVTDNLGATNTATETVVVNPAAVVQTPPTVSAGNAQTITLPVSLVTLTGTATGTNGATIASTTWSQASGPNAATIVSVGNLVTAVSGLQQGTYSFLLSVTDNNGQTASSSITVTVNAPAAAPAPTVGAGSAQTITLPANSVTLTGTATGNGGATIATTQWTQTSGPATASIGAAGSLATSVSNLVQGTYTFTLTGTDNTGQSASANVTITVNAAAAIPPTVSAGNAQTITLPTSTLSLTGTATANGGATIGTTQWTQTAGPATATIATPGSLTTTVSNLVTAGNYAFLLTVKDNNGQSATSSVTVTVNPAAALPPTVSAGSAQTITLPASTVSLTGTASGNGGAAISTTQWTQTAGPAAATIGTPASLAPTVSNLVTAGTYTFVLSATDNNGQAATASVTVTVNPAPLVPPTVSAGSDQSITLPTSTVTLTGTATGNGGATIASTTWTETSGPSTATLATPAGLSTSVTGLVQGSYTFTFTATDSKGQTATSSMTVTVGASTPPPTYTPPTVSAGSAQAITLPANSATLTGTATGNGGATIASTTWSQIGGPTTAAIASASQLSTAVSNLAQGSYVFLLSATDNNGQTSSNYVTVTVNPAAVVPPTVSAGSAQAITLPANSVTLTGTASGNSGATISTTTWSQIGGPATATIGSASQLSTTVSNLQQGSYVFLLSVTDNNNQTASAYVNVTVNAAKKNPPSVNAGVNKKIKLPVNSTSLAGTATANNGGTIVSTQWSQAGGPSTATIAAASSLTPTVSNLVQGDYVFMLNAQDDQGQTAASYVTVQVDPADVVPPTVSAGSPQTITLPANSVTLTGMASAQTGASVVSTTWTQLGGPAVATIVSGGQLLTTITNLVQGYYTFQLTAQDNNGQTASSTVTVTVNAPVQAITPPTVNATATSITLPATTSTLVASANGTNGATISSIQWSQTNGPALAKIQTPASLTTAVSNLTAAGVYTFQVTVVDNHGQLASTTVNLNVSYVQTPPSVNAGVNVTLWFPASGASLEGTVVPGAGATIVSTTWTQVSGPSVATMSNPSSTTCTMGSMQVGTYVFQLSATDNNGNTGTDQATVNVERPLPNIPPISNPGQDQTVTLTGSDTTIVLDGSASYDPDGTITVYSWFQLSGKGGVTIANSNTPTATVHGLQVGTYLFALLVKDNSGATTQAEVTITINAPGQTAVTDPGLIANAGKDTIIALPANTVQLNGSGSSDAGGAISSYRWEQVGGPEGMTLQAPGEAATQATNLVAGLYTFRLTVTNQKGDTASATVKVTVMSNTRSAKDTSSANFFLFPNPAHDQTTLTMTGSGSGTVELRLFDINGKPVKGLQFTKMPGTSSVIIDVSRLAAGMYIIRATYGNNQAQQIKLMKQ